MTRTNTYLLLCCLAISAAALNSCRSQAKSRGTREGVDNPVDYRKVVADAEQMLPRIRRHVRALSDFGSRQTGQEGCDKTFEYIRREISEATAGIDAGIREFSSPVTVTLDRVRTNQLEAADDSVSHLIVEGMGGGPQRWPAYALVPNCVQPCATHQAGKCPLGGCEHCEKARRLVDLGQGEWDDFKGKKLDGAVVLLDFNSYDAWLRAVGLGAYGAIFIAPRKTTVFQADVKYLAMVPLYAPRLYVSRERGLALRKALARRGSQIRVTPAVRMRFENVQAKCLELTIAGKRRDYCFVLASYFDARSIVPDMSYGAAELWGPAELIELTRHFARNQPQCDLRILFVSGHWQSQRAMRDYVSPGHGNFERLGEYFKLAMGIDLDPEGESVNMISESNWDIRSRPTYAWLSNALFSRGGWRDEILEALKLRKRKIGLYGGNRSKMRIDPLDVMAPRDDRCRLIYAPKYPTAEEPWQALSAPTFAFQTGQLKRLSHNTPLDRLGRIDPEIVDKRLRPQLQISLAVLEHLQRYPANQLPDARAHRRKRRAYGGYAALTGQIQQWDRSIGWFAQRLPKVQDGRKLQTFIQAVPVDRTFQSPIGPRLRNYQQWPLAPDRNRHRLMQSFMFQDLLLQETSTFRINTVYAAWHDTQYNVVAYSIDNAGRICLATDFGTHGDGNKSFQCTDLDLDGSTLNVPVSMFECGALELFDLIDQRRYNPTQSIKCTWIFQYGSHRHSGDGGVSPDVKITSIKDVDSHTDIERWGFSQYGHTAMVFLPARHKVRFAGEQSPGAEIVLGAWPKNFAVLNNPDAEGKPRGYSVKSGQCIRLSNGAETTPLACVRQLSTLGKTRLAHFATHDVVSPLANGYRRRSTEAVKAGLKAQKEGDWQLAWANFHRAWIFESQAYRNTMSLLLDVVSTTVLYFVLLIPFSFLVERLVIPQRTVLRTVVVSVLIFALFASLLYLFHPGFKLAGNVVVTVIAFVIVVMTIPALILLLVRGVAMLRAIGSRSVITQRSEAETAGVIIASLSLAVSNMRRRRLRTALTLSTITILVMALVLLTSSSAFDFKILEPAEKGGASFQGIQLFNAVDRRRSLMTEMVEVYEAALADEALVIRRENVSYGYDHRTPSCTLYIRAGDQSVRLPYLQVMDARDNLIEYNLPDGDKIRKVHLSDLIEGEFFKPEGQDPNVCLLPNTMAEELGVGIGDTVSVMGMDLKVQGIWIAQAKVAGPDGKINRVVSGPIDRLRDLDGLPITTPWWSMFRDGEPNSPLHAPSRDLIIVTRRWMRNNRVLPTNVHSLIVIPTDANGQPDPSKTVPLAEKLAGEILNVDIFTHTVSPDGKSLIQKLSMHTATHVKGSSMMLVVLAAAVLMILAIMTGTVYERMREIHIFSAVGLSPKHVAGMFLIEALVFAGIASVLGYFLGIIALKGLLGYLKSTGQHQEFYPNYLGVFVLYSIGIAVLATVASSLYPIHLAAKIINPSGGGSWQLEESSDVEDLWRIRLPFIATTWDEAKAMMVYACDYMAMHQGERSGRFVCEKPPVGATGDNTLTLTMPIWLAPFERNLSQDVILRAKLTEDNVWWELDLQLRRLSGPTYLWKRGATVFVNMLSKHLLRWRAASAEQEKQFAARADEMFERDSNESQQ